MKPYIVLLSSSDLLFKFIDQDLNQSMKNIMTKYWPGPLTIIFKAKSTLPNWMKSEQGTIAMRIPEHQGWQDVLEQVQAVFTTSANITDEQLPLKVSDIDQRILDQVQLVCYNRGQQVYDSKPSTILDFSTGSIQIIRQGAVVLDSI